MSPTPAPASPRTSRKTLRPLKGVRILSLALNLPGPAALMRCHTLGATCVKLEPPSGDPMGHYNPAAYAQLHAGVEVKTADLKTDAGQKAMHLALARTDVLLTSFRPSALVKLGLSWKALHKRYPALSHVAIVGAPGERAEEPGHDLTYLADNGLVTGLDLPPTLYADMGGSLRASEAVLQAAMLQRERYAGTGEPHPKGVFIEVALADAAAYLALPRTWGLTLPKGAVGGAHAGYKVYPCKDGRVAVAALEPHFAAALCAAAGVTAADPRAMMSPGTHAGIAAFLLTQTRKQLDRLAVAKDIPLHTLA
jgi:crotonobetainyl-CoA:carnitine CoA-transferase CaiB-like acyl-CoA transferase